MADERVVTGTAGPGNAFSPELLRRVRRIEIRSRRLVNSLFLGEYHAVFRGRGIEFSEVREYIPGDDVRSIDWNVTARQGKPFIKKFVEERELTVLLLVDVSASGSFGTMAQTKREVATEVAALLALSAINNQDRVGLLAFTDAIEKYVAPAKGQRHVLRLVRELLSFAPRGKGTDITAALDYVSRIQRRRAVVFIISDFLDQTAYEAPLRVLSKRHDLVAITLTDPRELELPDAGLIELEDAETGEVVLVDTSDRRVRAAYAEEAEAQRLRRERLFKANGIETIDINTAVSYVDPLMAFFRRRARGVRAGQVRGGVPA